MLQTQPPHWGCTSHIHIRHASINSETQRLRRLSCSQDDKSRTTCQTRRTDTHALFPPTCLPTHYDASLCLYLWSVLWMICIYQNGDERQKAFKEAERATAQQAPHQRQLLLCILGMPHRLAGCHHRAGLSRTYCVWTTKRSAKKDWAWKAADLSLSLSRKRKWCISRLSIPWFSVTVRRRLLHVSSIL